MTIDTTIPANPPLKPEEKGRLRWNAWSRCWDVVSAGPKLAFIVLRTGQFRAIRIRP